MKNEEKRRIYRKLAEVYKISRELEWMRDLKLNELCQIGYVFADKEWTPSNSVLSKYIKNLKKEKESLSI